MAEAAAVAALVAAPRRTRVAGRAAARPVRAKPLRVRQVVGSRFPALGGRAALAEADGQAPALQNQRDARRAPNDDRSTRASAARRGFPAAARPRRGGSSVRPTIGALITSGLEGSLRVSFGTEFTGAAAFAYGVLLVPFMLFLPRGIAGLLGRRPAAPAGGGAARGGSGAGAGGATAGLSRRGCGFVIEPFIAPQH